MPLDNTRARTHLANHDFKSLFIEELGWDHHTASLQVPVDGQTFTLTGFAHKRGMVVFTCPPMDDGRIPPYPLRRRLEQQVARAVHEHLIIYLDSAQTTQVWQWVKREAGRPTACREHQYSRGQPGDALLQKLRAIAFSLDEEEGLTIFDVTSRARAAFDLERVTRRFYDRFKAEHAAFLRFITGIPDEDMQRWYASVMLNRLMFIYFIQKKGFLDGDPDYLRAKLAQSEQRGRDRYYSEFLCPLFFEGFAKREVERSAQVNHILGRVPYLDGSLFMRHKVEEAHGQQIRIPDSAFKKLFEFFEQYHWHLDERPLRADNEINPDVLGYIFEKYVNQKQMGAYYTKEDITEYIAKNTIIPRLFDMARDKCRIAFEGEHSFWNLLKVDPDRYIYPAMKRGIDLELPEEIAAGLTDVAMRTQWNRPAPADYALPTEIWREVVARRQRYAEVRGRLADGQVREINDLITYNLDIRQFAQDVIENCEGPELLRAFWHGIESVTVLDPTCGSGAFLFAALNILEPLYEACLDRMQVFLDELERSGERHHPEKYGDFRRVLRRIDEHPNRRYFILKSIIVNNLFGVDIMEEATEICKLRLFLKLVAQIERVEDIEPLPDIDFNIRCGNTLVGFASREEVRQAITTAANGQVRMLSEEESEVLNRIEESAELADRAFQKFRQMQTEHGLEASEFAAAKDQLRQRLKSLEEELNHHLAKQYGINLTDGAAYSSWLRSHQPFHWFIEFYGILGQGGFDAVVGNPPYVEYARVRKDYLVQSYKTESCGNLYPMVMEQTLKLIARSGRFGLIVPLSLVCTRRMSEARVLVGHVGLWLSCFDMRPSSLFEETAQRLCIVISDSPIRQPRRIFTGGYRRWSSSERSHLIETTQYTENSLTIPPPGVIPKLSHPLESVLLSKIQGVQLEYLWDKAASPIYVHRIIRYFVKALDFVPLFVDPAGNVGRSDDYKQFHFTPSERSSIVALLNSSLFYWYWRCHSDGFHCGYRDVFLFPYRPGLAPNIRKALQELYNSLMEGLRETSEERVITTRAGTIRYQEFSPKSIKSKIDEIDRVLAQHYGFTDEELDFIINYDIKYRMGQDGEEGLRDEG